MQLTRERWLELAADHGAPHVTLTLPLDHEALTEEKNRLGWKNLVAEAERQLERFAMAPEARRTLLAPARALLEQQQFARQGARGLAMLLSRDAPVIHWCEHPLPALARVSDRFDLSPLLDHLMGETEVHVLALSDRGARLLRCTAHEMEEIPLPSAPPSLAAANAFDVEIENRGGRTAHAVAGQGAQGATSKVRAGRGEGAAAPSLHQQGFGYRDRRHDQLGAWLRSVHEGLVRDLGRAPRPLVLACTERVFGMWRELFGEDACAAAYVPGNPVLATDEALRERALGIVREHAPLDPEPWFDRYFVARRDGRVATRLRDVLRAGAEQRLDTLLVCLDGPRFGRVLEDGRVIELDADAPGAVDLSAQAVALCLANGGRVLQVEALPEPADGAVCNAILRW